jgi:hypothetical protein
LTRRHFRALIPAFQGVAAPFPVPHDGRRICVQFCPRRIPFKALGAFFCPVRGHVALRVPSHGGPTAVQAWPDAGANKQATTNFTHRVVIPLAKNTSYHHFRFTESKIFYLIAITWFFGRLFGAAAARFELKHIARRVVF